MEIALIIGSCAYLIGIIIGSQKVALSFAALILVAGGTMLVKRVIINKKDYLLIITAIILFSAGVINIQNKNRNFESFQRYDGLKIEIEGMVVSEEVNEQYYELNIELIKINGESAKGNVVLYNYSKPFNTRYQYGDVINTIATFTYPKPAPYKGAFSYELNYRSKGIVGTASYISAATDYLGNNIENNIFKNKLNNIFKIGYKINKNIINKNKLFLPNEEAEILNALMLGDTSGLSQELYDDIKKSGVAHAISVSGLHVSILLMFFIFIMQRFCSRNYILNTVGILGIIFFYLIVGYTPAMARSVLMSLMALSACYFNRRQELLTSVAFSALIIAIFRPFAIFDVGLILSFAATLAIVMFVVPLEGKVHNYILSSALVTFFATISTMCITAYYFNNINLTGFITNIVIIPLTTIALIGGYIAAMVPFLMKFLSFALYIVLWLIKIVVIYSAKIPYLNIRVPTPNFEQLLVYIVIMYLIAKGVKSIAKYNKK